MKHRSVYGVARIAASFVASLAIFVVFVTLVFPSQGRANERLGWAGRSASWVIMAMPVYAMLGTPVWIAIYIVLEWVARFRGRKILGDTTETPPPITHASTDSALFEEAPIPDPLQGPWRIVLFTLGLGLVGLLVTPIAINLLGLLLPGYNPSAQGTGFALFLAGVAAALPGAAYGILIAVSWMTRRPKADDEWFWTAAIAAYAAAVLAVIATVGVSSA
jgi:hypothetical protein